MGLGWVYDIRYHALPNHGPAHRAGLQLVDAIRPSGRPRPPPRSVDHSFLTAERGGTPDPACRPDTIAGDTSSHGRREYVTAALQSIAKFFAELKKTAEQLTDAERWACILSQALRKYLRGRKLQPPPVLLPA